MSFTETLERRAEDSTALRIKILGFVDLAAHFGALVGGHAAAGARTLLLVLLLILRLLHVGLRLVLLHAALLVVGARLGLGLARIALHLRQAEALGMPLRRLAGVVAVAVAMLLGEGCACAEDQGARQHGAQGPAGEKPHLPDCLLVVECA